jgi:hypothetical protein
MNCGYIKNEEKLRVTLHSRNSTTHTIYVAEKLPLHHRNKNYIFTKKIYDCVACGT